MHGNVREWVEDCWNESYQGAPSDGSAWTSGDRSRRVLRGGSWGDKPGDLRSAIRIGATPSTGTSSPAFGLPGRSAESGACPLKPRPLTTWDLGEAPRFSAPFAPEALLQRTLWDGNGDYGMGKGHCDTETIGRVEIVATGA